MVRGFLDHASRGRISGWAFDKARPSTPLSVVIEVDGQIFTRVVANRARPDVEVEHGAARCGFDLHLPGLNPLVRHVIAARVEGEANDLDESPIIVEAATAFDPQVEAGLARLIADADGPSLERAAFVLAEQVERILAARAALQSHEMLRHFRHRWFKHRGPAESDRPADPPRRALIVDSAVPIKSAACDDVTIADYALSLRRLGYDVDFVPIDLAPPVGDLAARLARAGVRFHHHPFLASVEELLRRHQGTFDVVLVNRLGNAMRYSQLVRHYCSNAHLVSVRPATEDDVDDGAGRPNIGFGEAAQARARIEQSLAWRADAIATPRETDAERLREALPDTRVHLVPWAVPARPGRVTFERRQGVAFLDEPGAHRSGTLGLIGAIMTHVRAENPAIACLLRDGPGLDGIETWDVPPIVLGPDVSDEARLNRVRLSVVLADGLAGRRLVCESFAAGVPCIAPLPLLSGLGAPRILSMGDIADLPRLAAAILRLHDDGGFHAEIRRHGLDFIDFGHSEKATDAAMRALLRRRAPLSPSIAQLAPPRAPSLTR